MFRSRGTTTAPIRINKPDEPNKLVKGEILGSLSRWDVEKILGAARVKIFKQGEHLFEEGSFGGTLFVVKKGAVELLRKDPGTGLLRAVGYAKEGDPIGELALFTGQRIAVSARVPDFAEIHVLTTADFKRVLAEHPELCLRICGVLATALGRARAAMDEVSKAGSSLGGSLGSFDLASVLNNIVEAGESSGILIISDRKGGVLGEIGVRGHEIKFARGAGYSGEDAVYSLLMGRWAGSTFKFVPDHGLPRAYAPDEAVAAAPTSMILDSLRMKDELGRFETEIFKDSNAKVRALTKHLACPHPSMQTAFGALGEWIQSGGEIASLAEAPPLQRLRWFEVVHALAEQGQVLVGVKKSF